MRHAARVTLSMRELDRLKCIQAVVDGEVHSGIAAERLGITTRQLRRIAHRYRAEGPIGLISRHRNRPSNRRLKASVADTAFRIVRELYADFGPTLAAEKLRERHGINLASRDGPVADGRWRALAASQDQAAEDPATAVTLRLRRRADPDRRLQARVVRGPGTDVHHARVCRRCNEAVDDGAVHGNGVDVRVPGGGAAVPHALRQAATGITVAITPFGVPGD